MIRFVADTGNMKSFRVPLLCLLFHCAVQTLGVTIQSEPEMSGGDVIQTEVNKTVSLLCLPDGGSETVADEELVWLRNDATVRLSEENRKGRSSVCVAPVIVEDNGATFTCHLGKNATVRASVTLNVTYAPDLSGSEEVAVEDTTDLNLWCDIWANPPVTVLWTLDGSELDLIAGRFTVTNDGYTSQLHGKNVGESLHEGTYRCTAVSPMYGEFSKSFQVTVTEKTIVFPLMPMIAGIVVVCLTALLAFFSRWRRIVQCFKSCQK